MKKRTLLLMGLACALGAVFAVGVRGDAAGEIGRLAELMPFGAQGKGWGPGTVVAAIGGGVGEVGVCGGGTGGGGGARVCDGD
jgi:hypothetical protein